MTDLVDCCIRPHWATLGEAKSARTVVCHRWTQTSKVCLKRGVGSRHRISAPELYSLFYHRMSLSAFKNIVRLSDLLIRIQGRLVICWLKYVNENSNRNMCGKSKLTDPTFPQLTSLQRFWMQRGRQSLIFAKCYALRLNSSMEHPGNKYVQGGVSRY